MTAPIGHLRNPGATRGDRGGPIHSAAISRTLDPFASIDEHLAEFAAAGARAVVIEGGDGTVREVLSRAPAHWPAGEPAYAIVPAGNTNLIVRQAGAATLEGIAALVEGRGARRELPVLRAERAGARPLRGFILGAGAYAAATTAAQRARTLKHGPQVAFAVIRALLSPAIRAPSPIGFSTTSGEPAPELRTVTAVTSLPGPLIAGLDPFWGGGDGDLRWLDVGPRPHRLPLGLVFTALGRPRAWMAGDYRSGR
ncbi:MAG: diacylglycerol kinase family protein, partial [Pseudomonadota bacterium]